MTSVTITTGNATSISTVGKANSSTGSTTLTLDEMISDKVQPILDRADTVSGQIASNKNKIAAYEQMQTLLTALQTASSNLTSQALEGSNSFNKRSTTMTSSSTITGGTPSDGAALMSVTADDRTATGTHTVVVNQIAQPEVDISGGFSSTTTFSAGTFEIYQSGNSSSKVSISVTASDTLSSIADKINATSDQNGITASVIAISSSKSVLVITGADENQPITLSDTSGTVLSDLGLTKSASTSNTNNSATAALGVAGSFTINGNSVSVTATMSITDVMNAVNTAAGSTVATLDSQQNRLSISGTLADGADGVLASLGYGETTNKIQSAQGAILTVDGVSGITRDTNEISDVISGVTLNLKAADPNTKVTVGVVADTTSIASAIASFVTAYNAWQDFVAAQDATNSDGTAASTAILFGDSTLRTATVELGSEISSPALGTLDMASAANLAAIGISLNSSNKLEINQTTLTTALTSKLSVVAALFQNSTTVDTTGASSGTTLKASGTNYSTYAGVLTFSYDGTNLSVTDSSGKDYSSSFTVSGGYIRGNSGTTFSGLNFTFSGTGTLGKATVTEGLANQVYQTSKSYGNTVSGSVQTLIANLESDNITLNSRYTSLITQAQDYTDFLTAQYATISAKMAVANQTLLTLQALIDAGKSSS